MQGNRNNQLMAAILIAAVIIGGALVYLGSQLGGGPNTENLGAAIEKGIANYIQKQQGGSTEATRIASAVDNEIEDDDPVLGQKNAPIALIEFSDYECPFCKRNFTQTLPQLQTKYIDTGKVKLVYRDFPLSFHDPLATEEALAAECVREQKGDKQYFAYHDLIFKTTNSNGRGMEKSKLYELAGQVGANQTQFTECLDNEKFKEEIDKDIADGQKAGISGTPGFILLTAKNESKIKNLKAMEIIQRGQYVNQYIETKDGKRMGMRVSGAQPFSTFEDIFELLLN